MWDTTEVIVKKNKAFTLIELLVVIAIIALLIGILLPAIGKARDTAKNVLSQSRMRQLALGANSYAADNKDLIFSFSWPGGFVPGTNMPYRYDVACDGDAPEIVTAREQVEGGGAQITEILRRVTGRCEGDNAIDYNGDRLWQRRWSHVVLLDYLTSTQPEPIAASPFDSNLLDWAANPLEYRNGSTVPFANGAPDGEIFDEVGAWDDDQIRNRWAFASSYQTVPAAWNSDGINTPTYTPVPDTPHLFQAYDPNNGNNAGRRTSLGGRKFAQVAFPAGKVLQFEEFDRLTSRQGTPFMFPEATCNLSFFDGSVRRLNTSEANPGWNPRNPDQEWLQTYRALDTFPTGNNDAGTQYCQRYRWTRFGLRGVDFGGKEIGRPFELGTSDQAECFVSN